MAAAKAELDPADIMNRGKYPRLNGRLGGVARGPVQPQLHGQHAPVGQPCRHRCRHRRSRRRFRGVKVFDRAGDDVLLRTADECAMCGACVGVCPAYLLTKDERVTARGQAPRRPPDRARRRHPKEHAHRISLCMRCKACEQVCQSKLHLIDAVRGDGEAPGERAWQGR